jgi:hypothetical protein
MAVGSGLANDARIDQALYGYADGHRLLTSSKRLSPRDHAFSLALSDTSGSSGANEARGYLTGYPLVESGCYALARTWPAPEMNRPGCVWTHTLLIDFSDLALLSSPASLLALFRRPALGGGEQSEYSRTIDVTEVRDVELQELDAAAHILARQLLWSLYKFPRKRIWSTREIASADVEVICLGLWGQQWPRLRRSFRFCTATTADRSIEGHPFDLQILAGDRGVRPRFRDGLDARATEFLEEQWLVDAELDLLYSRNRSLRDFLNRVGPESSRGRDAFSLLLSVWRFLTVETGSASATKQLMYEIALLEDPPLERQLRSLLVGKLARHHPSEIETSRLVDVYALLAATASGEDDAAARGVGLEVWKRLPDTAWKIAVERVPSSGPLIAAAAEMNPEVLLGQIFPDVVRDIDDVLDIWPNVIGSEWLWRKLEARDLLRIAPRVSADERHVVLAAIIRSNNTTLIQAALSAFGSEAVIRELVRICDARTEAGKCPTEWMAAAFADTVALTKVLANGEVSKHATLIQIARNSQPDSVINEIGDDPWLEAVSRVSGRVLERDREYFAAFLLARALGNSSKSPGELIALSFDEIYVHAKRSRLSPEAWALIDVRLPTALWWAGWDRCKRLRAGVVDVFLKRSLPFHLFVQISDDEDVFDDLVREAAEHLSGRDFLEGAKRVGPSTQNSRTRKRVRRIQSVLRH